MHHTGVGYNNPWLRSWLHRLIIRHNLVWEPKAFRQTAQNFRGAQNPNAPHVGGGYQPSVLNDHPLQDPLLEVGVTDHSELAQVIHSFKHHNRIKLRYLGNGEFPQCRFWFINEFNHALVNLVCSSRGLRRRSSTAGVLSNFTSWSSMRIWRWSFRRFGRWTGVCGWGFRWCINSVAIVSKNSSRFPHSVRIEMTSFSAIAMSTFSCVRPEHASEISRNHRIKYLTLYHGWWRGALSGWQE